MNKILKTVVIFSALLLMLLAVAQALPIQHAGVISDSLFAPTSLAVSSDQLAVLEPYSQQLKVFTPFGAIETKLNLAGEINGLCRLNSDTYLFCDQKAGKVYAVDLTDKSQTDYFDGYNYFTNPTDIIVTDNMVIILDAGSNQIILSDQNKSIISRIDLSDNTGSKIGFPASFGYNKESNSFYVFDQLTSTIWCFGFDGSFQNKFASFGANDGQITRGGELICGADYLFVSDRFQNRITIYSSDGEYLETISGSLNIPTGLALDENGLLYVASTESSKIDIFNIPKALNAETAIEFGYYFPTESDTVFANNIKLVAQASTTPAAKKVTGFDFELYAPQDLGTPLYSISKNEATVTNSETVVDYNSEWQLPGKLEEDAAYQWRTRPVFENDLLGDWSEYKQFTTSALPDRFILRQNYPNPFNPETKISFTLPKQERVVLEIINLLGQKVRTLLDKTVASGSHEIIWDSRDDNNQTVASGVYFYRLSAGNNSAVKKMVLLK